MARQEKDKQLHAGHRERKKKQFLLHGADSFADHELLELLLFFSVPRADTNELAHRLLERFGSLRRVLDAPAEELMKVDGIGEHSAVLLRVVVPVYRRALASNAEEGLVFTDSGCLRKYFETLYTGESCEVMYQLCLDAKGGLLRCFKLGRGTPVSVGLDIREIVSNALSSSAAAVVLAHNHPGGYAEASASDIAGTEAVRAALAAISVALIDHVIIADGGFLSFHDARML